MEQLGNGKEFFSKRTEIVFFFATAFFLIFGSVLIALSEKIIPLLYKFFSEIVFHRDFSLDAWSSTLQSIILIPVFTAIFFNVIFFHKHSDSFKVFYLTCMVVCVAFLVTYTVFVSMHKFMNSDLASETLLAKECVYEKSFVPRGWRYSTEIRFLNTQLISAPLFLFIESWDVVRALTSLFSCCILFWSGWVLISKLNVKKTWLKLLGASLLSCPWSTLNFFAIGWGNYYIPHIVMAFATLSVFISILDGTAKNQKKSMILFYVLSFISGLSTIRYILNYQFPLAVVAALLFFKRENNEKNISLEELKKLFWDCKPVRVALAGLLWSGLGYAFNSVCIMPFYYVTDWNREPFNYFGDESLLGLFSSILRAFGYQEHVALFTPGGLINFCVYFALIVFAANALKALKLNLLIERKFFLFFTIFTIAFNSFIFYHIEFNDRYYIPILVYMIPCVIIFIDTFSLGAVRRYFVGTAFALCIFASSFISTQDYLSRDPNKDLYPVMNFLNEKVLKDEDYSFGYSISDYASVITYYTNGKIEVAIVPKESKWLNELDGLDFNSDRIVKKFAEGDRLIPIRYYRKAHVGKTFLMLPMDIYKNSIKNKVFESGTEVYNDGKFLVFEYESQKAFLDSYGE